MIDLAKSLDPTEFEVTELSRADAAAVTKQWVAAFFTEVRLQTGSYRYRDFHWHAFSYDYVDCWKGSAALQIYTATPETEWIILPESFTEARAVQCSGPRQPDLTSLKLDLYVFPISLAWTMAFTHSHGPYFAERDLGSGTTEPDKGSHTS